MRDLKFFDHIIYALFTEINFSDNLLRIFRGFIVAVDFKKVWELIKEKKNVVGFSSSLKNKIVDGEIIKGTKVIRVYVSKKEPLDQLDPVDAIPETIEGIETDVVQIGEIKAQGNPEETVTKTIR